MTVRTVLSRFRHIWQDLTRPSSDVRPLNRHVSSQSDDEMQAIYRGLFEQDHDAVFVIDLEGNYTHANQRGIDLLGYTLDEIRQLSLRDVSTEYPESQTMLKRFLAGEYIPAYERSFHKKDGTLMVGEINAELVRDAQGKPHHIQSVVRDIGSRKKAEEALRRQNEYLTVLNRMTFDLLNRRTRDDLLDSIVNHVSEIIDAPYVEIRLREGDELVTYACTENQAFAKGNRGRRDQVVLTWQAYDSQQVVTVEDYSSSPLRNKFYQGIPFRAVAYFPIIVGHDCLGVLDLSRVEPNKPFTAEEIQQGHLFAQLVALLLDNLNSHEAAAREIEQRKQAEEALHRHNEYLTAMQRVTLDLLNRRDRDDLLKTIIQHVSVILDATFVEILLKDKNEMVTVACTPNLQHLLGDRAAYRTTSLVWKAHDTQKFVTVDDYSSYSFRNPIYGDMNLIAVACFPIIIGQVCVGVLDTTRSQPDRPFTAQEVQQGALFAQLIALLLDNLNSHEAAAREIEQRKQAEESLYRQNEYLTVMHRITLDLINRRNRDDLLQSIIEHCSTVIKASYVEISMKEGDEMVTYACTPNISFLLGDRAKRDVAPLVWEAHDTHHYVTLNDYSTFDMRRSIYDDTPAGAVACFPILIGDECVGTLDIGRAEKNHRFTQEELQQGTGFAQLVALLLDNANLHESAAREIMQRKQAEDKIRAIQVRQEALLSAVPDLIFRFDHEGRYLDFHARNLALLAYPPEQLLTMKITDVLMPELANVHMAYLRQVIETGQDLGYEYALTLNGKETHFESRMVKSGPDEVLTINRDITDRKQMEKRDSDFLQDMKALQEIFLLLSQTNDLRTLYSNMVRLTQERLKIDRVALFIIEPETGELVGTFGVDPEGQMRDESYYREKITSTHWTLRILNNPKHAVFWEEMPIYDNGIQVGMGWKTAAALWDGQTALGYLVTDNHINHQPPRSYQDELSSLLGSTYGHLVRLKQTQITLRQNEERQRALLSAMPDLMFRFDRNGVFLDYHSANESDLAVPPEQFMGRKISEVMPPEIAALQTHHMKHVLQTGHEAIYEYSLNRGGKPSYFESRMVASGHDEVITIIRDITERKALEEQSYALVMETARANVLGQFVQNASHELRTPLSTINTALYLINRTDDASKRQVYADRASEHIRQLSRLLDMVLSMTKLDSALTLDIQPVDLNDWVKRVVNVAQEQAADKKITVTFVPNTDLLEIQGDPVWLQEAFGNLVDNAIRFTPPEGTITVCTYSDEGYAVVEVKDSGVGISSDALPHIFERFWRQDEAHSTPGFGLGLSIALKIIEMHDGRIEVESHVGKGSTFKVLLPLPSNK